MLGTEFQVDWKTKGSGQGEQSSLACPREATGTRGAKINPCSSLQFTVPVCCIEGKPKVKEFFQTADNILLCLEGYYLIFTCVGDPYSTEYTNRHICRVDTHPNRSGERSPKAAP